MDATAPKQSPLLSHLAAAFAAFSAAVLMTWPLARDAGDHILAAIYDWDAYTNTMIMGARVDAVLGRGPLSFYENYFFAPLPNSIVYNENLLGLSLIFAPLYLITGSPLWAYNATLLLSLALSVFFTYLLVRRLTGSGAAGVVAGVAFAFCPYVMFELGRIQLVATQWIPACFLMLHRAIEGRRPRDVVGFWLCYLLQIGTCLYYAMFLIPLLSLVAGALLVRLRPPLKLYGWFAGVGAAAAGIALVIVYPYFTARDTFVLERSLDFASSYDGRLSFFANVPETNLTLTSLHHVSERPGAHEEIAFPGFTILALALVALGAPAWQTIRERGLRALLGPTLHWANVALVSFAMTVLARSMLAGAVVIAIAVWRDLRSGKPVPFSGRLGLCLAVLVLSVTMFLGLEPMSFQGGPVHGLYYYFYTYFPGFDGIRKVSRQAVMTTFAASLLASFGSAWLLARLSRPTVRGLAVALMLGATCFELRSFPHPVQGVWAGTSLPEAYRFMASLPPQDLVATVPQNDGIRLFRGDYGLTLHNYLMLFHKHRSLNGQSSWMPPVTDLVLGALSALPGGHALRVLRSVGARHILVHGADLEPRRRDLPDQLAAQPEAFRRVFRQGADSVFSLVPAEDPTLALAAAPRLPESAQLVPRLEMRANANLESRAARNAVDGSLSTAWTGRRVQARGQYFEIALKKPRSIIAFEIQNTWGLTHVPMSFELSLALGESSWRTVAREPALRVPRDLVYSPKTFVFRIVLSKPTLADHLRLTLGQPVPGRPFTIQEARVYEQEPESDQGVTAR